MAGPIFANSAGHPLDLNACYQREMKDILKRAGLCWHGWHGFRRGLASNLNRLGIDDSAIQRILRHSTCSNHTEPLHQDRIARCDCTGVSPYKRSSNCLRCCAALQSQGLTVVLTHQNSPEVTSFVTFGTPLGTVKMHSKNSGGYGWSQRITRFRSLALFPIPPLRQVTLAPEEGGSQGFPVPGRPGQTTSGFPRAAMKRTRPKVSAVSPRPLVDLPSLLLTIA
jgi:hypothetical protein